jgi:hypothetical protein
MTGSVPQRSDLREPLTPRWGSLLQMPPGVERAVRPVLVAAAAAPRARRLGRCLRSTRTPPECRSPRRVFHERSIGTTCRNVQCRPTIQRGQASLPPRAARPGGRLSQRTGANICPLKQLL